MISMREMIEAGVHFGHQTRFWNPRMEQYIYTSRNKIHIINLEHTKELLDKALAQVRRISANKGNILFVCTKRQARDILAEEAQRANMPYINQRWLGGTLTNFKTVKASIKRLLDMEQNIAAGGLEKMGKKVALDYSRDLEKLQRALGGIKGLNGLPDAMVVIDVGYHKIAITEANKLGIPVIGVVDTNHTPDGLSHMIPGNDDSTRAIRLYARAFADAVLEGRANALTELAKEIREEGGGVEEEEFVEVAE